MVRIHPDPPGSGIRGQVSGISRSGAVAQLGERLLCKQEAVGSIPSGSTSQESEVREQETDERPGSIYRLRNSLQHSTFAESRVLKAVLLFNNSGR